jgi:uncharacterized protein YbjT (DUF2867 family)
LVGGEHFAVFDCCCAHRGKCTTGQRKRWTWDDVPLMPQPLIAITGATGTVGSLVAERLADQGASLRLIVRDAAGAPPISGVDVAAASSYAATDEMTDALRGADTLFFVSGLDAAPDSTFTLGRQHYATEQAIRESGIAFAFQQQNFYLDFVPFLAGPDGVIKGPADDGKFAPVARSDVADVAVALLTDSTHDGETFRVTGRERFSLAQVAERMTALTGKRFSFVDETIEQAYASRAHFGAPDWEVEGWVSSYAAIGAGELNVKTDHVLKLTGHEPMLLDEFLRAHPESYAHIETSL